MNRLLVGAMAVGLCFTVTPASAMAAAHKARPGPSNLTQLNAVMKITAGPLRFDIGTDCTSDNTFVTFTATIDNLTKNRTIRAVRASMTWSFFDAFEALDSYDVEWDQVTAIPPGG